MRPLNLSPISIYLIGLALFLCCTRVSADVFFVDPSAFYGNQDGSNWPNAFLTLQPAIDAAAGAASGSEVWVAGGATGTPVIYGENRSLLWGGVAGSLVMRNGVALYGGFEGYRSGAGREENARNQRERSKNVTVIDGSKARGGNPAYHVIVFGTSDGATTDAVLDGFTITGGNASGIQDDYHTWRGGAIFNWQSTPIISNCIFHGNTAAVSGGAVANVSNGANNAGALFLDCLFYENSATRGEDSVESAVRGGGAVFNNNADATFMGCTMSANTTGNAHYKLFGSYGGAVYNWNSSPVIDSCILMGNDGGILDDRPYDGTAASAVSYTDAPYAHQTWAVNGAWSYRTNEIPPGMGNIVADPLFVAGASGNYALQPSSPCIDMGSGANAPPEDIAGVPRPQGANYDMGAYEVTVPVIVPELSSLARVAAQELVFAAHLYLGRETEEYHPTVPNGQVIRQTPVAGTQVMQRTPVDLVISKGPEPVSVPDVVGQTQGAAAVLIAGANLVVGTVTQQYSLTVPIGNVVSQSPAPGAQVLPGAMVDFAVSRGGIVVPDVVGQAQGNASAAMSSAGLVVVTVTEQYSATVSAGKVISQIPWAGSSVLPSAAAYLVVSRGVQPAVMPNVAGQTRAQAELALSDAGLVLGSVTLSHSSEVPSGAVVSQSPAAGTELLPGTAVSIVVSLGAVPLPEGEGEAVDIDTARQQLAAAYASADTNGDGGLSFAEAAAAVTGLTQAEFDALDVNHDGQLTPGELGMGDGAGCAGCRSGKSIFFPADYGKRAGDLFLKCLSFLCLSLMAMLRRP